jgi:outer membrane cobalamin receptor
LAAAFALSVLTPASLSAATISEDGDSIELNTVVVTATPISKVKDSAFNAVAISTDKLANTTRSLSEALNKAPGMKIRESGGVGSDMAVTMDGFSGKHIKVFIDGVPQEGVGSSFGLNNIPANFAERIEIYRGAVPVGFGTDAIGGVINIVTPKRQRRFFIDASYSYGSFNTHRSHVNFGQTFSNGLKYELNLFQNYSDNNYWVDTPVEDFTTGSINRTLKQHVKRFNDTYHNEAVVASVGLVDKSWTDRLMLKFTYSKMYKEVQTGVRQEIVYGQKHRHGYNITPALEYVKRNLLTYGLDLTVTANYNRSRTTNVDTAMVRYNWLGETIALNSPGEQSNQLSRSDNNNWTATANAQYRWGGHSQVNVNEVFNAFNRSNTSLLTNEPMQDAIAKVTNKSILGVSYRYLLPGAFSASVFGKHYAQHVAGPIATTSAQDNYVKTSRSTSNLGFGAAATWTGLRFLQAKLSYEKAYRLPTIEEMFGDEDLEVGDSSLKPESSHNLNFNVSYNARFNRDHSLYVEAGLIYRDTRDYIQRNLMSLSGGKSAATYINYGKVRTTGYTISARYDFKRWISLGGNLTQMNVRDNMPTASTSSMANLSYKERMPNVPWLFADSDITLNWNGCGRKANTLSLNYDNQWTHSFCYYASNIGSNKGDYMIPNQFAHNLTLTYAIANGRYNFSVECRNFTNAALYDNFSLQKAGRAFYGKFRVYFGN